MSKNKIFTFATLVAITALGFYLHLLNISYPPRPVFDEAHFATYAADYVKGVPFFDIHPPFGKLIYSATLSLAATPQNVKNTDFVIIKGQEKAGGDEITVTGGNSPFNNFPYIPLRVVSAIFGAALALIFYWFLRSLGVPNIGAILGALFLTLENALLLETRLILMDGMYLAFGFAALALYFKKPQWPTAAGAVWGLALGVKMTAVVFAGPLLIYYLLKKKTGETAAEKSDLKKFSIAAVLVFLIVFSVNYAIFTPMEHLDVLKSLGMISYTATHRIPYLTAPLADLFFSFGNYVVGSPNILQSPWYLWPAMQIPMTYFYETVANHVKQIVLTGNPFIWYSSTLAAICALAILPRYLKKFLRTRAFGENKPFFVLLAGFVVSILPFATIVRRSTFLYHYFPAYIFAIGLLVWSITKILKVDDWNSLTLRRGAVLAVIAILSFAGFLYAAPFTYGL